MERRYLSIVLLALLLSSMSAAVVQGQRGSPDSPTFSKGIIYVDDSNTQGPWNGSNEYPYQTINEGLMHAVEGDTIYVFNGLYPENVLINKTLYIRGEEQENTIIDGQNNGSVITVCSENVRIRRFTLRNSGGLQGDAGVLVQANSTTITECTMYRARAGIDVLDRSGISVSLCRFHTDGFGVVSSSSSSVAISQCTFYHNGVGVYLFDTACVTITGSYADTNGIGFLAERSSHINITGSAARDNDDNEGGMFFEDCQYVSVSNSYLVHNGVGVNLINSSACFIDACNFSRNTHFACKLKESSSSMLLTNCVFTENLRYGLFAENSSYTIKWSNLYRNKNFGLFAKASAIDASYNWWGAKNGPAYNGLVRADRGTWNPRDISYRPWLTFPMPEIGPDWILEKTFEKPSYVDPSTERIVFSDPDTDGDGAPDWWEIKWGYSPTSWDDHQHLDPDNDALNNIEECYMDKYGSDPFEKDLFLEIDWTRSLSQNSTNRPQGEELTLMIEAFAKHNISLHVDTGELGGGEELPAQERITFGEIITIYWDYFLHGDLNNPRQHIFHYGIFCDYSESNGFAVMGWNHLNAFIISAQHIADMYKTHPRGWLALAAGMHEVGHTCGLIVAAYNGIDNHNTVNPLYKEFWMYLPYRSMLNYHFTYSFFDYSDGSHGRGDFNDWANLNFSFFKNTRFEDPLS